MMRAYILKAITLDHRLWINFKEAKWKQKEQLFQGRDDAGGKCSRSRYVLREELTEFLMIWVGL